MLTPLLLIAGVAICTPVQAENAPKKPTTSAGVYESETERPKTKNISAKVKVIRDETDSVEVFFTGGEAKGGYNLYRSNPHFAEYLHRLEESRKPQGPKASVIVEEEDKKIISVESSSPAKKEPGMWD